MIMNNNWPIRECKNCGSDIRLIKTQYGWKPYEADVLNRTFNGFHNCETIKLWN